MFRPPIWLRLIVAGAIAAGAVYFLAIFPGRFDAAALSQALDDYGAAAWLAFIGLHAVTTLVFVPRTAMAIAAGVLFGAWWGLAIGLAGALAGASLGFAVARHLNSGALVVEDIPRIGPWLVRAEAGGWKTVFALRLVPFIPHSVVNYAFGLTRLPFVSFLTGSFLGFIPIQFVCARLGDSGRYAVSGAGDWIGPIAWGVAFLVLAVAIPRLAQRALRDRRLGTFFGFAEGGSVMPTDERPEVALSEALRRVADGPADQDVMVGEVLADLGSHAHLLALVLLSAPNLTPGPSLPGFSTILGLPLLLVAGQMMLGHERLWLPRRLVEIKVARRRLAGLLGRAIPLLQRVERLLRPRWRLFAGDRAKRPIGGACLALGVILSLPIPLFTMAPAAAILLIALGAMSRDGAAVALGLVAGLASFALLGVLAWLAVVSVT